MATKIRESRGVMGAEWFGTADDGGKVHVVWLYHSPSLQLVFGKQFVKIDNPERFGFDSSHPNLANARKAAKAFIMADAGSSRRKGTRPSEKGHVDWDVRSKRKPWSWPSGQKQREYKPGEIHRINVPYSEAAMHLGVAGKTLPVKLTKSGRGAQIYVKGREHSFPVTTGEAGIHTDYQTGRLYGEQPPGAGRSKGRTADRAARRRGER